MRERDIEDYLVRRVKELGGAVRKVKWIGRARAPDRLVMLPDRGGHTRIICGFEMPFHQPAETIWVEVKNPETIETFPANAHERAQHREHEQMRKMGQRVEVVGTLEQVDRLLS